AQALQSGLLLAELRERLRHRLPAALVPQAVTLVDALPLAPSGKVDRKALRDPQELRSPAATGHVAARNPAEQRIAAVWREVLGLDEVSVHDNFFDLDDEEGVAAQVEEVVMHRHLVVQAHDRLRGTFSKELSVVHFFQYPTVAALAAFL